MRRYALSLGPKTVKPGQTVLVRAVAWDRRAISDWGLDLGPQRSASGWHAITIVAPEAESAALLEQLESLRAAIWKLLEKQSRRPSGRRRDASMHRGMTQAAVADVRARQIDIQKSTVELAGSIGPSDRQEQLAIKRALNALAFGGNAPSGGPLRRTDGPFSRAGGPCQAGGGTDRLAGPDHRAYCGNSWT